MLEKLRRALARDMPAFSGQPPRGYLYTSLSIDGVDDISEDLATKGISELSVWDERGFHYLVRINIDETK